MARLLTTFPHPLLKLSPAAGLNRLRARSRAALYARASDGKPPGQEEGEHPQHPYDDVDDVELVQPWPSEHPQQDSPQQGAKGAAKFAGRGKPPEFLTAALLEQVGHSGRSDRAENGSGESMQEAQPQQGVCILDQ
jgi:hypothetical protein